MIVERPNSDFHPREQWWRVYFGVGEQCYSTEVTATSAVHALLAAAAKLGNESHQMWYDVANRIMSQTVRVKRIVRSRFSDPR
jgi:hypothetical protein